MDSSQTDFNSLENLLKAPSKEFINKILLEAFNGYVVDASTKISDELAKNISESLEIDRTAAEKVYIDLGISIKKMLFDGLNELTEIQNIFAGSALPANLKTLLSKLMLEKLPIFRKRVVDDQNIMPKLVDFNWRVDIKMASNIANQDASTKLGQQACILQLRQYTDQLKTKSNKDQHQPQTDERPILDIYQIIKSQFVKRSQKQLGLLSFYARIYPTDKCGSNGLPLTPNSIRIYGKFQFLKSLVNKYLTRYVDIQRGNDERLFVVSEHYSLSLFELLNDTYLYNLIIANQHILDKWLFQLLKAFEYLAQNQVVHRCLSLKNICLTSEGNIKLANYGLFYMTEYGFCANFPVSNSEALAPECLLLDFIYGNKFDDYPTNNNEKNGELNDPKADIWSLGVVLFQLMFGINVSLKMEKLIEKSLNLLKLANLAAENGGAGEESIGYEHLLDMFEVDGAKRMHTEKRIKPALMKIIKSCLNPNPAKRPDIKSVLRRFKESLDLTAPPLANEERRELLNELQTENEEPIEAVKFRLFGSNLSARSRGIKNGHNNNAAAPVAEAYTKENRPDMDGKKQEYLWRRDVSEVYYLWRLAGGDYLQTLKHNNRLQSKLMPIFKLPVLSQVEDGCEYGKLINDEVSFDDTIVPLSLDKLKACLQTISLESYYQLLSLKATMVYQQQHLDDKLSALIRHEENLMASVNELAQRQPLNIREAYVEYQFHRMITFSRYLACYPFKKEELVEQCKIDIPPFYRALTWAILLNVRVDIQSVYDKIDKESITATDRQIDLDVPRCHQYDPLMASPQAHYKLKRLLKAWVVTNKYLVYWQGLDSLSAPFLYLNFNNEAIAYGCLMNFVNKYSTRFFLKDNSMVIHEYLAVFSHLIAFHDAELASHFERIEFRPDLYAIPWFLTMFAHVFPLYKIVHLWDSLLLGNNNFPLCIGVAILRQLRKLLLSYDFNDCIQLFSEMPEINITKCVSDSNFIYNTTPSSCLYRQHSTSLNNEKNDDPTQQATYDVELDMSPVGLAQMRVELCPRISAREILDNELRGEAQFKLVLIDIRPSTDYQQLCLPNSFSVPFESISLSRAAQLAAGTVQYSSLLKTEPTSYLIYLMQQHKSSIKVIITSETRLNDGVELANKLVELKYDRVCLLNRGIECFRSTNMLLKQI